MTMRSTLLYRIYFAPKSVLERTMARYPSTRAAIMECKSLVRKFVLPKDRAWVRVRAGLSEGMTMQLRFPEEAGVWRGEHEPEVQSAIQDTVLPGWIVFDIGAAIGTFALGTARLVGETGRVIAFDGDALQVGRLREHTAANKLTGILHIVHAAVWAPTTSQHIPFRYGNKRSQSGIEHNGIRPILADGELVDAPVTSLDAYIASTGLIPKLLKIDVEGAEAEVLEGGKLLFATFRPLIVAEIHTVDARDKIREWAQTHTYSTYEMLLHHPAPIRLFAWPKEQDPGPWLQTIARLGASISSNSSSFCEHAC